MSNMFPAWPLLCENVVVTQDWPERGAASAVSSAATTRTRGQGSFMINLV